jgi:hypothetical protein
MLPIGKFIQRFRDPLQAELVLMQHFAAKKKALCGWDRRYAHMQFVLKWAPVFRRHVIPSAPGAQKNPLAA